MRNLISLAALLIPALLAAVPARAVDPAQLADLEKKGNVTDIEDILLAVDLSHPGEAPKFDASAAIVSKNPSQNNMDVFWGYWRGKMVTVAETQAQWAGPDFTVTHNDFDSMLTADQLVYLARMKKYMTPGETKKLNDGMLMLNGVLKLTGGKVPGLLKTQIMDQMVKPYHDRISGFIASAPAQAAKSHSDLYAQKFSALGQPAPTPATHARTASTTPAATHHASTAPKKPTTTPSRTAQSHATPPPAAHAATTPATPHTASQAALSQVHAVVDAASAGGAVMDGQRASDAAGASVPVDGTAGSGATTRVNLTASAPGGAPPTPAGSPAPPSPGPGAPGGDDGGGIASMMRMPIIGGAAIGAIIGGLLGFILGGPLGAVAGAAIGGGAGAIGGHMVVNMIKQKLGA